MNLRSLPKVKTGIIFFASLILSLATLFLERMYGIGWDYHPDAITYVTNTDSEVSLAMSSPLRIFNNSYYFVSYLLGSSVALLISLNVIIYSITNCIVFKTLAPKADSAIKIFILIIFIFTPYRLHLSTVVLKDTILIFFLVVMAVYSSKFFIGALLISARSLFYIPIFLKNKHLFLLIFALTILAFALHTTNTYSILDWVYSNAHSNFSFRSYDQVANFKDYGDAGILIRALVWPFLFLTGGFIFFSSSPLFFPLALGQVAVQVLSITLFRKPLFSLGLFVCLFFFAIIISGFTTYFRYVFPMTIILPLIFARAGK